MDISSEGSLFNAAEEKHNKKHSRDSQKKDDMSVTSDYQDQNDTDTEVKQRIEKLKHEIDITTTDKSNDEEKASKILKAVDEIKESKNKNDSHTSVTDESTEVEKPKAKSSSSSSSSETIDVKTADISESSVSASSSKKHRKQKRHTDDQYGELKQYLGGDVLKKLKKLPSNYVGEIPDHIKDKLPSIDNGFREFGGSFQDGMLPFGMPSMPPMGGMPNMMPPMGDMGGMPNMMPQMGQPMGGMPNMGPQMDPMMGVPMMQGGGRKCEFSFAKDEKSKKKNPFFF